MIYWFFEDVWGASHHDSSLKRTEGFDEFVKVIRKYKPERTAQITGIAGEDIVRMAECYAKARAGSIVYCMGITQHTTGVDNVKSLANLAMLCGHIGRPGTGVNPLRGQNNVQGACDMGALPNVYPGYQAATDDFSMPLTTALPQKNRMRNIHSSCRPGVSMSITIQAP